MNYKELDKFLEEAVLNMSNEEFFQSLTDAGFSLIRSSSTNSNPRGDSCDAKVGRFCLGVGQWDNPELLEVPGDE